MNSSEQNPALPTWIFIATDAALICVAAFIALRSPHPLPASSILWIVACVGLGVAVGLVPVLVRYERQKNEFLDERQRALEALTKEIGTSAGQVVLAANALQDIAELAHRNLRMAEHLPHKLQDKIAEFQSQVAATSDGEKEELEKELLALRTSESERLEAVSQRIAKSTAEWAKLEAASHQHLTAAEQALSQAKASTLAEIDARLAAATSALVERVAAELGVRHPDTPKAGLTRAGPGDPPHPVEHGRPSSAASASSGSRPPEPSPASITALPAPRPVATAQKAPRTKRDDDSTGDGAAGKQSGIVPLPAVTRPATMTAPGVEPPSTSPGESPAVADDEPVPVPANTIPEITPIVPVTAEPFSGHIAATQNGGTAAAQDEAQKGSPEAAALPATPKPARKRAARKHEGEDEPALGLELDEAPAGFTTGMTERVRTSDGATRLLVTAYIGIGNRLYIRGDGPGLSWDKGTPLQFVSIGKWRWETNEASAPVQFKLYKNDDVECPALGAQSLNPGQQQELTAAF